MHYSYYTEVSESEIETNMGILNPHGNRFIMNKRFQSIILSILVFIISGCSELSVTPCMELSRITPEFEPSAIDQQATISAQLDPKTEKVLEIYPLRVGSTWVYDYLGFDETMEVIWRVTETVVETKVVNGFYLAKLERMATCQEGDPPEDFPNAPETGTFWYLIDENKLYFFEDDYDLDIENAWLDLIIPLPSEEEGWYPQPDLRENQEPDRVGYRQASDPYQEVLPIGGTYTCYNVATEVVNAKAEQTFCETIGFLYKEYIYFERDFGYRVELVGFSVQ